MVRKSWRYGGLGVLFAVGLLCGYAYLHAAPQISHPLYTELEAQHEALQAQLRDATSTSTQNGKHRKVIAVLLYNGFTLLDAAGPMQALKDGVSGEYQIVTVAKEQGEVASDTSIPMTAEYSFANAPTPDVLIVPGGIPGSIAAAKDAETLSWIRSANASTTYTASVCTGAWILAAAGVLNGRHASTYWAGAQYLESLGALYTGKRYTIDGKYITSAGVSSGIEMGIALVAALKDEDTAKAVELALEYDPKPPYPGGTPAKSDPELVKLMQEITNDRIQLANH